MGELLDETMTRADREAAVRAVVADAATSVRGFARWIDDGDAAHVIDGARAALFADVAQAIASARLAAARQAREEAAKVCDDACDLYRQRALAADPDEVAAYDGTADAIADCARSIRALAAKGATNG